MGFSGDFQGLKSIERGMARVPRAVTEATRAGEKAAFDEYQRDFAEARDPMGQGWAPTRNGGRTLYESGDLANPMTSARSGAIRVRPKPRYGWYHQKGTGVMKARKIVPNAGTAGVWEGPIRSAIEQDVNGFFRVVFS